MLKVKLNGGQQRHEVQAILDVTPELTEWSDPIVLKATMVLVPLHLVDAFAKAIEDRWGVVSRSPDSTNAICSVRRHLNDARSAS